MEKLGGIRTEMNKFWTALHIIGSILKERNSLGNGFAVKGSAGRRGGRQMRGEVDKSGRGVEEELEV